MSGPSNRERTVSTPRVTSRLETVTGKENTPLTTPMNEGLAARSLMDNAAVKRSRPLGLSVREKVPHRQAGSGDGDRRAKYADCGLPAFCCPGSLARRSQPT